MFGYTTRQSFNLQRQSPYISVTSYGVGLISLSLLVTFCSGFASADFTDTILSLQLNNSCAESPSTSYLISDENGIKYLKYKFSSAETAVSQQATILRAKSFNAATSLDFQELTRSLNAISSSENAIISQRILLGLTLDLLHCYDTSGKVPCTSEDSTTFETSIDEWNFKFECDGWKALFVHPSVRFYQGLLRKVVISLTFNLKQLDINQCPNSRDVGFNGTSKCPADITTCEHTSGNGFVIGSYVCRCNNCAKMPCTTVDGSALIKQTDPVSYVTGVCSGTEPTTTVSPSSVTPNGKPGKDGFNDGISGCRFFKDRNDSCIEIYVILAVEGLCVLLCIIFAVVVIVCKSEQVIKFAKPFIMEIILIGAVMMYCLPILRVIEVDNWVCLLTPWLREMGFIFLFGAIILKTYKSLAEFQTRKARRVHIRDKDLLKYWFCFFGVVLIYLAAWTALNITYSTQHNLKLIKKVESNGVERGECIVTGWNYVTQIAELLLIAFALYMSYRLRAASSLFWESRFYTAVLAIEFILSLAYYVASAVIKFSFYWSFIMTFAHVQLTTTVALLLIFIPKFHYICHSPKEGAFRTKAGNSTDFLDFRTHSKQGTTNGDIDLEDINIAEMDPDDIKKEMRRVYEQLQTLKVKVMRYENPHLHKKPKLPFYKQKSKHGFNPKKSRSSEVETDLSAATIDSPELEPLNASPDNGENSRRHHSVGNDRSPNYRAARKQLEL